MPPAIVMSKPLVEIWPPLPIEIGRVDARVKFAPNTSVLLFIVRPLVALPKAASLMIVRVPMPETVVPPLKVLVPASVRPVLPTEALTTRLPEPLRMSA